MGKVSIAKRFRIWAFNTRAFVIPITAINTLSFFAFHSHFGTVFRNGLFRELALSRYRMTLGLLGPISHRTVTVRSNAFTGFFALYRLIGTFIQSDATRVRVPDGLLRWALTHLYADGGAKWAWVGV